MEPSKPLALPLIRFGGAWDLQSRPRLTLPVTLEVCSIDNIEDRQIYKKKAGAELSFAWGRASRLQRLSSTKQPTYGDA